MPRSIQLRFACAISFVCLISYAFFLQSVDSVNVSSRMFLTLSIVGYGDLSIDRYADKTIDKALSEGRYYTDKAPGLSLLALPVIYLAWNPVTAHGRSHAEENPDGHLADWPPGYTLFTYLANLTTSVLTVSASVAAMFLVSLRLFGSPAGALLVAAAYGLATPVFGWATAFMGHATAAALLFIGFASLYFLDAGRRVTRRDFALVVTGTASLTWAIVTEFTAAPAAGMIAVFFAIRRLRSAEEGRILLVASAVVTGFIFVLPLLLYNSWAFGDWMRIGYQSVEGFPGMDDGLLGLRVPSVRVLYELIFGLRRGLLIVSPFLLLVPVGLIRMLQQGEQRGFAILIFGILSYYVLFNSSYFYWDGGWSSGPRHLTAMLPFACLPLGSLWMSGWQGYRVVFLLLSSLSFGVSLLCATAGMFAPSYEANLILDYLIPEVQSGASASVPVRFLGWRSSTFFAVFLLFWGTSAALIYHRLRCWTASEQKRG